MSLFRHLPRPKSFLVSAPVRHVYELSEMVLRRAVPAVVPSNLGTLRPTRPQTMPAPSGLPVMYRHLSCNPVYVPIPSCCVTVFNTLFKELGTIYNTRLPLLGIFLFSPLFFPRLCCTHDWPCCDWLSYEAGVSYDLRSRSEAF